MAATASGGREGAHRPREEHSLELGGPGLEVCCPALPEAQPTAPGQDAEPSCTWKEASLRATNKICLPHARTGAVPEQKNASETVPGNVRTCQEKRSTLALASKEYLETAPGKE